MPHGHSGFHGVECVSYTYACVWPAYYGVYSVHAPKKKGVGKPRSTLNIWAASVRKSDLGQPGPCSAARVPEAACIRKTCRDMPALGQHFEATKS